MLSFFAGLLGDKACGFSTFLLCGSCRSVGHLVQGFKPSAHSQVGNMTLVSPGILYHHALTHWCPVMYESQKLLPLFALSPLPP